MLGTVIPVLEAEEAVAPGPLLCFGFWSSSAVMSGHQEERLLPVTAVISCLRAACSFEAEPYEDITILVSSWLETSQQKIK